MKWRILGCCQFFFYTFFLLEDKNIYKVYASFS